MKNRQGEVSSGNGRGSYIPGCPLPEKCFLIAWGKKNISSLRFRDQTLEMASLARSAGLEPVETIVQRTEKPNPKFLLGQGKVDEVLAGLGKNPVELLLFNRNLSPAQGRNWESASGIRIVDRTELILDIFGRQARSREARCQVELAQLEYSLPRLKRMWTHLSRQSVGGVGLRGPGETQLETDRRGIRKKISILKDRLAHIRDERSIQRKRRMNSRHLPLVALVGYTNAGKSTLLNALATPREEKRAKEEDRLFATLDPKIRKTYIEDVGTVLFADTVGFIYDFPYHLTASFRATFEEIDSADLLLLVLDAAHPGVQEHRKVSMELLEEFGLKSKTVLEVYNQCDRLAGCPLSDDAYGEKIYVSAKSGWGLERLKKQIAEFILFQK